VGAGSIARYGSSTVVIPPPVEPVTLADAKLYHRIDSNLEDAMLTGWIIPAAREYVEGWAGVSLVTQTREAVMPVYIEGMALPYGPVQSVESVSESAPYTVRYVAGYPPVEGSDPVDYVRNIPASFKQAMQLLIGEWYETREHTVIGVSVSGPLEMAVHQLIGWYRQRLGIA